MNAAGPPLPWFVFATGAVFIFALAAVLLAWLRQRTAVLVTVLVLIFVVGAGLMTVRVQQEHTVRQQVMEQLRALGNEMHSERDRKVEAEYRRLEAEHEHAISGIVTINGERVREGSVEFAPEAATESASAGPIADGQFVAKKPAADLPEWARLPRVQDGDTEWLVLGSSQHADLADATAEVQLRAQQAIATEFQRVFPECALWTPPTALIDSAFRRSHVEESTHDFGKFTSKMYRVYWQVELSSPLRAEMHACWAQQMRMQRLQTLCAAVGGLTLLLAGSAGYFRIFARAPQMQLKTHYA